MSVSSNVSLAVTLGSHLFICAALLRPFSVVASPPRPSHRPMRREQEDVRAAKAAADVAEARTRVAVAGATVDRVLAETSSIKSKAAADADRAAAEASAKMWTF